MSELKEKGLGVFINLDKWGISTFTLKIIAMITMIIDHVGFLFFQDNHQTYIICPSYSIIFFSAISTKYLYAVPLAMPTASAIFVVDHFIQRFFVPQAATVR